MNLVLSLHQVHVTSLTQAEQGQHCVDVWGTSVSSGRSHFTILDHVRHKDNSAKHIQML